MATVTGVHDPKIKKRPTWRYVYLDGWQAFGASQEVLDEFKVREGARLSEKQIEEIRRAELRHECMQHAIKELSERPESVIALRRRLLRLGFTPESVEGALEELQRRGEVDDLKSARRIAERKLREKLWDRSRVLEALLLAGFERRQAERAVEAVYGGADASSMALELARKLAPRVKPLDAETGRRRLTAALLRRGFGQEDVDAAADAVLGKAPRDD